jgi:hypothetical protein
MQLHVDRRTGCVPPRVGQRLLHYSEGRQLDARIERLDRTADDEAYASRPGVAHLVQEIGQLPQAGLGPPGRLAGRILPQYAQQPPHLGERGTRSVTDGGQPPSALGRQSGRCEPGRLGLQRDHRDVVRHHVVQFSGDAGAFAAGGVLDEGCRGRSLGG